MRIEPTTRLQFAYFRTWHDRAADPEKPNSFADIPQCVDLAFVFPDFTPPENHFWQVLREEYVPMLHERGTALVHTGDIGLLLDPAFPNTPQGNRDLAEHLVESKVLAYGLDGLDIDMERRLSSADAERATEVFHELSRLIGKASGDEADTMLIYDTNLGGDEPVFAQSADWFDFVLEQAYGRSIDTLQPCWDTFAPHIPAERFLIGFSFYEEFDLNRWDDTSEPFEDSRAAANVDWQPEGATKGGVFSYAIDRDNVRFLDDEIRRADYSITRQVAERLRASTS